MNEEFRATPDVTARSRLPRPGGLILAGGKSRRMGFPKGTIRYHGVSQVDYLTRIIAPTCSPVLTAVPREMAAEPWLASHSLVFDAPGVGGPMGAVLAAFQSRRVPWLVVAVDMPFLNEDAIARLVAARSPESDATAYLASDGGPEPLCCVYEPSLLGRITRAAQTGQSSLRDVMQAARTRCIAPLSDRLTESVDTPADYTSMKGEAG